MLLSPSVMVIGPEIGSPPEVRCTDSDISAVSGVPFQNGGKPRYWISVTDEVSVSSVGKGMGLPSSIIRDSNGSIAGQGLRCRNGGTLRVRHVSRLNNRNFAFPRVLPGRPNRPARSLHYTTCIDLYNRNQNCSPSSHSPRSAILT